MRRNCSNASVGGYAEHRTAAPSVSQVRGIAIFCTTAVAIGTDKFGGQVSASESAAAGGSSLERHSTTSGSVRSQLQALRARSVDQRLNTSSTADLMFVAQAPWPSVSKITRPTSRLISEVFAPIGVDCVVARSNQCFIAPPKISTAPPNGAVSKFLNALMSSSVPSAVSSASRLTSL